MPHLTYCLETKHQTFKYTPYFNLSLMDFNPRYALLSVSLTLLYFTVTLDYVYAEVSMPSVIAFTTIRVTINC